MATGSSLVTSAICRTADDILHLESRMVIGRVLRAHLDQATLLPSELLHLVDHAQAAMRVPGLFGQGLRQVASAQAKALGEAFPDRARALEGVVSGAFARARQAEKQYLPSIETNGLAALSAAAHRAAREPWEDPAPDAGFLARAGVARDLARAGTYPAKLEALLRWAGASDAGEHLRHLDPFIADLMDLPVVVREVTGPRPSLGAILVAVVNLARGEATGKATMPRADVLVGLLRARQLPQTRDTLLDKVRTALRADSPLDPRRSEDTRVILHHLVAKLVHPTGMMGGPGMTAALLKRVAATEGVGPENPARLLASAQDLLDWAPDRIALLLDVVATQDAALADAVVDALRRAARVLADTPDLAGYGRTVGDRAEALRTIHDRATAAPLPPDLRWELAEHLARLAGTGGAAGPDRAAEQDTEATVVGSIDAVLAMRRQQGPRMVLFYRGQEFVLDTTTIAFAIGRGSDCDLVLTATCASRRHATVRYVNGDFMITDQSTNGSFVQIGRRAPMVVRNSAVRLEDSGLVAFGATPDDRQQDGAHIVRFQQSVT